MIIFYLFMYLMVYYICPSSCLGESRKLTSQNIMVNWRNSLLNFLSQPVPEIHPPCSAPLQSWRSDPLWEQGNQFPKWELFPELSPRNQKWNLQALELFFPNYLSSSREQKDGEIPTWARTLYHLGPNSLRKAWGIDPHPQRHWKNPESQPETWLISCLYLKIFLGSIS